MQNNKPLNEAQLQALLRLKRYEMPPPGYFDDLLNNVHRRQREELLRRPAWQIAVDRVRAFFAPLSVDWRHATSMAALLVIGIGVIRIALPERTAGGLQLARVTEPTAGKRLAAVSNSERVLTLQPHSSPILTVNAERPDFRNPDHAGAGAPTRFIIDTQPASYEATQIRF
jgi:hypothetical protein